MNSKAKTITAALLSLAIASGLPVLSQAGEIPARGPIPFMSYDLDQNGTISNEEFYQARGKRMAQRAREGRRMRNAKNAPAFEVFDANGDGKLTQDELRSGQKAQMEKRRMQGRGQQRGF